MTRARITTEKTKKENPYTKWTTITYVGKETNTIARLFKNTRVRISYLTRNTIQKILINNTTKSKEKYIESGIYQLNCPDCDSKYVGQTGRSFRVRFAEHFRDFKYQNNKSKFAQHLLEQKHSIGPIENIMEKLHTTNNGRFMNTVEQYHIYKITQKNVQINDKNTVKPNIVFQTLTHAQPDR
jgi:ATP-dependent protease HslVU (ClpYQ) ATPase subunit